MSQRQLPTNRVRRVGAALILAITATLFGPGTAAPASAAPTSPSGSPFVWADSPSAASYTPSSTYQCNSTAPFPTVNPICRSATGDYAVYLPGLAAPSRSGIVLVIAASFPGKSASMKLRAVNEPRYSPTDTCST